MKKFLVFLISIFLLCGCQNTSDLMDCVLTLRRDLINAERSSFHCVVNADYGTSVYEFSLECTFDKTGNLSFVVKEPESIRDITGKVRGDGGQLVFDEEILAFPVLADGYLSPVSAPWMFMKTLRSGRIESCGDLDNGHIIKAFDSYSGKTMQVDISVDTKFTPYFVEFVWDGRRILSMSVSDFCYL